jgi:GAF domain-containing protein
VADEVGPRILPELARIASELGPALAPPAHRELLTSITVAARRLFHAEACSIALVSDDETELVFHVATGGAEEDIVGMRVPVGEGIAGWVVLAGQPLAIEDVQQDPRFAADFAASTGYLPRSILATPMETERRIIGVIEVLDRNRDADGSADMELLALFADQAALAIENSRSFGELGTALFQAAAHASNDGDVRAALERVAEDAEGPTAELAELAGVFAELGRLGPAERRTATRLVKDYLDYVQGREA